MKYKNGRDVLPSHLLSELQEYLSGELVYIPKKDEDKALWGQLSGIRQQVTMRNARIVESYRNGVSLDELTVEFCLSEASIRKIIYSGKAECRA